MRAGSTLLGVRSGSVRLGASCDSERDSWFKKYGAAKAQSECARGFKGKHGCDRNFPSWCASWNLPWGKSSTPSPAPAPAPSPTTPISIPFDFFGAKYTPATPPTTLNNPAAPATPSTPATPQCSVDWAAAAAEIRGIASSVRSCQSPNATIPALLQNCSGGTGSYDDYLKARDEYAQAKDDAVLCQSSSSSDSGSSSGSPTTTTVVPSGSGTTVIQAPGTSETDIPLIEPDTSPVFSRGAKVGAGIGGLLLIVGVAAVMMRKRTRSSRRRA